MQGLLFFFFLSRASFGVTFAAFILSLIRSCQRFFSLPRGLLPPVSNRWAEFSLQRTTWLYHQSLDSRILSVISTTPHRFLMSLFITRSTKSFENQVAAGQHFDSVCHWVHDWLVDFRLEINWHPLIAQDSSHLMPPVSQSEVTRDPRYLNWVTLVSGSLLMLMVPSVWGLHSRYSAF